jgi:hypothetical protein
VYADAVALAPDLPGAYYSWGVALAKHGDLDGAAGKLKDANQKGPHWADQVSTSDGYFSSRMERQMSLPCFAASVITCSNLFERR